MENLRLSDKSHNGKAYRKKSVDKSSIYKGVSYMYSKERWRAYITIDNKTKHIGLFHTEKEAAIARNQKAIELGWPIEGLNKIQP